MTRVNNKSVSTRAKTPVLSPSLLSLSPFRDFILFLTRIRSLDPTHKLAPCFPVPTTTTIASLQRQPRINVFNGHVQPFHGSRYTGHDIIRGYKSEERDETIRAYTHRSVLLLAKPPRE